jgi:hypothetical protein
MSWLSVENGLRALTIGEKLCAWQHCYYHRLLCTHCIVQNYIEHCASVIIDCSQSFHTNCCGKSCFMEIPGIKHLKQKKFMRNAIFTLVLLVSGFICSSQQSENYFKMGEQKWPLLYSEIANESYGSKSKFEIDLMVDSHDILKSKTFVWLSIAGNTVAELSDGIYYFSSTDLGHRSAFRFNGSVFINNQERKITKGSFSVDKKPGQLKIQFDFTLENGQTVKGYYEGASKTIDRSSS